MFYGFENELFKEKYYWIFMKKLIFILMICSFASLAQAELSKAESSVPISQEDEQLRRQQEESSAAEQRARKRREEIQRLNQMQGDGGAGDAEKSQGPRGDNNYARKIAGLIKSHTIIPQSDIAGNPFVEFLIELQPDGGLRGEPKMTKSSGIAAFDQAVKRAIENSVPFPSDPSTGKVPVTINITHYFKDIGINSSATIIKSSEVLATYPKISKKMGESGTVILRVLVTSNGDVGAIEIKVSSGYQRLDESALDAVKKWKFTPAMMNGNAIDEWYVMPYSFKLPTDMKK